MTQQFVAGKAKGLKVLIKGDVCTGEHFVTLRNADKPTSLIGWQTDEDSAHSSLDCVAGIQNVRFSSADRGAVLRRKTLATAGHPNTSNRPILVCSVPLKTASGQLCVC